MIERTFIEQGMKKIQLEQYLKKNLDKAGFTGLHIVKTPLVTRIVLNVARPGLAIGKGGQNIRMLTEEIRTKFNVDNPQIEIQDIKNPTLDARATVDKMVELVERGFNWKSVVFRTTRNITEAGAQGVELVLKGKLSGKGGRKRKHRVIQGYMKKVGDQVKLVDTAKASAYPKAGAIGITLSIIRPDVVFPDKINIKEILDRREEALKPKEEPEEAKAEEKPAEKAEAKKEAPAKEEKKEAGKKALEKEPKKAEKKKEKPAKKAEKKETKAEKPAEKKAEKKPVKEEKKAEKKEPKKAEKPTEKKTEKKKEKPAKKAEKKAEEKK